MGGVPTPNVKLNISHVDGKLAYEWEVIPKDLVVEICDIIGVVDDASLATHLDEKREHDPDYQVVLDFYEFKRGLTSFYGARFYNPSEKAYSKSF